MYPDSTAEDEDDPSNSSPPAKSLTPEVTVVQETSTATTPSPPPPSTKGKGQKNLPNPTIVVVDHEDHTKSGMETTLYSPNDGGQLPKKIKGKPVAGRVGRTTK